MAEIAPIELERAMRTCAIHQDPIHMITKDNIVEVLNYLIINQQFQVTNLTNFTN